MINLINQKPCVVETPQGFSVSYNNRFLYSRYAPSKLILQKISQLNILSGTIFLCSSPALCYGLPELIAKLPEDCLIVLCEFDKALHDFTEDSELYISQKDSTAVIFPKVNELYDLPITLFNMAGTGKYKRVIRIDFSSGTDFTPDLYSKLEEACINSVRTFWTNRLTLTKFGYNYSVNFFRNLQNLHNTTPIENFFHNISKPILVFGAGQSVDSFFNKYNIVRENYFILCVDTILPPLISRNIVPDGVFVEEAQSVISKAFICSRQNVHLFTGLSSIPMLSHYFPNKDISYFTTEYTKAGFINKLKEMGLLPPVNPPFGSVGLTTVYYALKFRKDSSIPVYLTGLDFSYSVGYTHGRGTPAHIGRLINTNRLTPIENYGAAFSDSSMKIRDKCNNIFITTPALAGYSRLFNNLFSGEKNIFDVSDCGIKMSLPMTTLPKDNTAQANDIKLSNELPKTPIEKQFSPTFKDSLTAYLKNQKEELIYLRKLLTENTGLQQEELKAEITKAATGKEYLYLHFPDGYKFQYSQSFLNRIRTEIDYFLRIFN